MRSILSWLFVLALMTPAPALSQAVVRYQVPAVRDDGWKTANADAVAAYPRIDQIASIIVRIRICLVTISLHETHARKA